MKCCLSGVMFPVSKVVMADDRVIICRRNLRMLCLKLNIQYIGYGKFCNNVACYFLFLPSVALIFLFSCFGISPHHIPVPIFFFF